MDGLQLIVEEPLKLRDVFDEVVRVDLDALGIQVCGWLLISISLPRLPAALTSVVLTIQPVASVLLGIWILSEAPSALQLLGVAFIIGGLLLATLRVRSSRVARAQPEIG